MQPHQLRIALSLLIRAARNANKTANYDDDVQIGLSYSDVQRIYNPIAKANILEGAHGWRKDSLLRRGQTARDVKRALETMKPDKDVHPSLTDFSRESLKLGPCTKYGMKNADNIIKKARGRSGISYDMLFAGLWNTAMLPGVGGDGLMDSGTQDFWFQLGRDNAAAIKRGRWTLAKASGATNTKIQQLALNVLEHVAQHGSGEDVGGVGLDEYQSGSGGEVSDENIISLLFAAISNPGKWHNRAKEWFNEHIGGRLSGTMLEVFEAYQHLGATPKGGIQGGYNAAAEYVNEKREAKGEAPISPKGVKKAWEAIKKRFPDAFEDGLHDRKYNDLMKGLLDDNEMASGFFGGRGYGDRQYDDSRLASIVKRHAYRQQLRLRKLSSASTKTAGTHTFRMPGALPANWKPSRYPRDFEMLYARDKKIGQYGQERYEKALKTWEQWKREGNPEAEKYDLAMIEKETIGYEKEKAYRNLYLELKAVFDKGDLRGLKERLWSANTFSKKLVSGWLGVKLPRTDKGTFAILDAHFGR